MASGSSNRQRGVEAITALAIQHNGLLSSHHQSLSESTPPTHTLCSNTHAQVCTNKSCVHACTPQSHRHCGGSLIMQLILSDSDKYNGRFPRGACVKAPTHPTHRYRFYLLSYLLSREPPPHPNTVLLSTLFSTLHALFTELCHFLSCSYLEKPWLLHSCPPAFPRKPAK